MRTDENFTRAYEKYSDTVYRIAFLILKNHAEAEGILQNVFLKLLKTKKSFESDDHLKAWLIVSAKNASKDILKSFWRKNVFTDETALYKIPQDIHTKSVYNAVMGLKDKYKIPLYLYYFEGYKTEEIAKILSKNPSTVRSLLCTARSKLKIDMEKGDLS